MIAARAKQSPNVIIRYLSRRLRQCHRRVRFFFFARFQTPNYVADAKNGEHHGLLLCRLRQGRAARFARLQGHSE